MPLPANLFKKNKIELEITSMQHHELTLDCFIKANTMTNDPFKKDWTPLEGDDKDVVRNAKIAAENLLAHFNAVEQSREIALAKTNLEQAMMWFTKGYVLQVDARENA